ncbi:phage I-like protein [Bradyrhizobium sp. AZCC 1610]|uniref:hypothetical protein n=1 Tax=Bradyrhizobium sp. AZCC 1610 TaxID=3117020 RepID=UPI002FEF8D8A
MKSKNSSPTDLSSRSKVSSYQYQPLAGHEKSARRSILVGQDFDQVEQRITDALCSGSLRLREAEFLQQISRKIGIYRERTLLSHRQAGWLFTILTSFEDGSRNRRTVEEA